MKKILSLLIITLTLFWFHVNNSTATESGYFRVTAYYSPLPNQKFYIKWNYKAEKRMNWEWIRWASWKWVFSWMLAAPKKYSFWTKIYLEWLWIWEVSDRGGAIVQAWQRNFRHDRIDVWVWYWDEWLRRAMYWGNRVVKWNIIKQNNKTTIDYKKIPAPYWATSSLNKNKVTINTVVKQEKSEFELFLEKELTIFNKKVENKEEVQKLQEKLSDLNLYKWEIDWDYNSIWEVITNYQVNKKIIKIKWELWTWYFWPKTRSHLKSDYKKYLENEKLKQEKIEELEKKLNLLKSESEKKATEKMKSFWYVQLWHVSPSVRELQKTLSELWFFYNKDTAIFWNKTKLAIQNYQIDRKIISNKYELWAGVYWPSTRKKLRNDLANRYLLEAISKDKELTSYYQEKLVKVTNKLKEEKIKSV